LQLLLFLGFSIGCVAAFRKPLIERRRTSSTLEDTDTLIGSSAIVSAAMKPGEYGKVELRGTTWNAQNIGVVDLQAGQRCRVDEADGLTLKVRG
jgi:membrane protein implicated in regulation of membrane protease activity